MPAYKIIHKFKCFANGGDFPEQRLIGGNGVGMVFGDFGVESKDRGMPVDGMLEFSEAGEKSRAIRFEVAVFPKHAVFDREPIQRGELFDLFVGSAGGAFAYFSR